MSEQSDKSLFSRSADFKIVTQFGLSDDEARVYLLLLKEGFDTALSLSKKLQIGRTKVYRLLDKLMARELVEMKLDDRGMKFGAARPEKFELLLTEKELELQNLKSQLPGVIESLQSVALQASNESKVLYYTGVDGLKQVSFNSTRTRGILRVFEAEHMSEFIAPTIAEKIRQQYVDNHVFIRDLTNKTSGVGYTAVTELIKSHNEVRHISPTVLDIQFEALIYNDVYVTYSIKGNEIFCVEMYNQQLADMQKQLFDFVWDKAQKMKFVDDRGGVELV